MSSCYCVAGRAQRDVVWRRNPVEFRFIEVSHSGVDVTRLNWLLSQVRVEAVTKESARRSAALLKAAELCGQRVRTIAL